MIKLENLRCYRNYKPLRIVNISQNGKQSSLYKIVSDDNEKIGSFVFSDDGMISNFVIKKKFRRKKVSTHAIFSILDFTKHLAKEKNIDSLMFVGQNDNKNNVVRLYEKIAYKFNDFFGAFFVIPLNKKGQGLVDFYKNPFSQLIEEANSIIDKA